MKYFSVAPQAQGDLEELTRFIALDKPDAARKWLSTIFDLFQSLAEQPKIGMARPEFGATIRSFPHGAYVIFYEPNDDNIDILRILHGSRDIRSDYF